MNKHNPLTLAVASDGVHGFKSVPPTWVFNIVAVRCKKCKSSHTHITDSIDKQSFIISAPIRDQPLSVPASSSSGTRVFVMHLGLGSPPFGPAGYFVPWFYA